MSLKKLLIAFTILFTSWYHVNLPAKSDTDKTYFLKLQNTNRSYLVHLPASYKPQVAYPVVLILHGRGGSGRQIAEQTKFSQVADQQSFIAVYPNAINKPTLWNAFYPVAGSNRDDIAFIQAMLGELQNKYKIDDKRIYALGYSSGAMLTYRIGSELSEQIAAIGVVSGSLGYRSHGRAIYISKPKQPVPALVLHGKKDLIVKYKGGMSFTVQTNLLGIKQSVNQWASYNNCQAEQTKELLQDGKFIKETYNCPKQNQVTLLTLAEGTHKWPSILPDPNGKPTSTAVALWEFLKIYHK
jgi:polyhydroxybutyrate depolymerase